MDPLEKILAGLSALNLEGEIVRKQAHASGLGGSCDVYSAWSKKHNKKVAVKQIRAYLRKDKSLAKKLASEIRIWAKLDHKFVLPLLGYYTEGENMIPAFISEWMERGTLHQEMKMFPRAGLETLTMLRDIASGLTYLHSKDVIHADLKSQNVLISSNGSPLIADFGLSLALSQSHSTMGMTSTSTKGTVRWMAFELLTPPTASGGSVSKPNKKTDVWSFGMLAYELLSWHVPYQDKASDVQMLMAIVNGELPATPDWRGCSDQSCCDALWEMTLSCWLESGSRPTANTLRDNFSVEVIARNVGLCGEKASRRALTLNGQLALSNTTRLHEGRYYEVWHMTSGGSCGGTEEHECQAQLTDDLLTFLCYPGELICPVGTVELSYKTNTTTSPWTSMYRFDFKSDSLGVFSPPVHCFAVPSAEVASAWVALIKSTLGLGVQSKFGQCGANALDLFFDQRLICVEAKLSNDIVEIPPSMKELPELPDDTPALKQKTGFAR